MCALCPDGVSRYTHEQDSKKQQQGRGGGLGGIQTHQRAPMVSSQGAQTPHQVCALISSC